MLVLIGAKWLTMPDSYDQSMNSLPHDDEEQRRDSVPELDKRAVTFAGRALAPEKIEALKAFIGNASAQEINTIVRLYGDVPEVRNLIFQGRAQDR